MANPTTNYGFVMPTNTDLVKDLPADFDVFGQAVDTKIKDLNPETTAGDISYRGATANAKTRLGIGTARQVLAVNAGATEPEWIPSSTSTLTTAGDLLYASAANTLARRAIGSTGDVLTVSGGVPTWAAPGAATDFTLLNAGGTALTGAATITVNITAYTNLYIFVSGASSASASSEIAIRFNGDSGNNYRDNTINFERGDAAYGQGLGDVSLYTIGKMGNSAANVVTGCLQVFGAKSSTGVKPVQWMGAGGTSTLNKLYFGQALYLSTSSITSISVLSNAGNFDAGTVFIYGAN